MDYVTLSDKDGVPGANREGIALLPAVKALRVGAYTVDAKTAVIRWRGEMLRLSGEQRQMLRVMLQHAGQILSCERLAALLDIASDKVDGHVASLRATLESAGVTWLPRRAEGCGYILWR
jgi:DNA-binding response OmpR family regulator